MQLFKNPVADPANRVSRYLTTAVALLLTSAIALPLISTPADAKKRRSAKKAQTTFAKPSGPVTIVISLGRQRLTVYDGAKSIGGAPISSGKPGLRTPKGVFTILQKRRRHYSNLYAGAPMPNMQRITWSGVAMHAGHLPGYPASHGCIRLPYSFSRRLFGITNLGTRVIVAQGQPKPHAISHPNLLRPLPAGITTATIPKPVAATNPDSQSPSNPANALLGVTPANAATPPTAAAPDFGPLERPTGADLTRASLAAFREREIFYLERTAKQEQVKRKQAADELKAANREVRQAQIALSKAKKAARKLSQTISNATRATYKASRRMQVFVEANHQFESAVEFDNAAAREQALETELLNQEEEREMARREAADLATIIAKRTQILTAKQDRRNALLKKSTVASKRYSDALKALNYAKQALKRRGTPITVLVSSKTMKIHVRQGYDPLFSAPIEITQPEAPLGTHIFTAHSYTNDGDDLLWYSHVAARSDVRSQRRKKRRRSRRRRRAPVNDIIVSTAGMPAQTSRGALERITISDEIRERLVELMTPGSAIIISDRGIGNETGEFTDIIVQTR